MCDRKLKDSQSRAILIENIFVLVTVIVVVAEVIGNIILFSSTSVRTKKIYI